MMRKILLFFCILFPAITVAQQKTIDAKLQRILLVKNNMERVREMHEYFLSIMDIDPVESMQTAQQLLRITHRKNDIDGIAFALSQIGYQSFLAGSTTKCIEYNIKALKLAERIKNYQVMATAKNRIGINYSLDPPRQIKIYKEALKESKKTRDRHQEAVIIGNLGRAYLRNHQLDSALVCLQKSERSLKNSGYTETLPITYTSMGETYESMKNPVLAKAYFQLGIAESEKSGSPRWRNQSFTAVAKFYYNQGQKDSAIFYADKAIKIIQNTDFSTFVLKPAKLLTDIYRGKNNDLAMRYADMFAEANEKVNSFKTIQENQLLTFDEELRQQKIKEDFAKTEAERRQNIQYAFIATGIITFFLLFLLLSRTVIVNEKWISFLAILALLLVFEFVNLLIHPFLEKATHHSPFMMLLCLVLLASLLIPLHHKLEKWIKEKMTEKNKAIRLASAKKTIEQLDNNSDS